MNAQIEALDRWARTDFMTLNTQLDEAYFAQQREIRNDDYLRKWKEAILIGGAGRIEEIAASAEVPASPEHRYELLGLVGYYLGACRRHEIDTWPTAAQTLAPAWALASRLGSSLGVAPRYTFAHQVLHGAAVRDDFRTFTSLVDERIFIKRNGLAVLAYRTAANALRPISAMGASNPMTAYLLQSARNALSDVLTFNKQLAQELDVDRFFLNIRPYFKPYSVAGREYRGTNAGDFSAINEIDVALGLCDPLDLFYRKILIEKHAYVPPEDQPPLCGLGERRSLLNIFLHEAEGGVTTELRANANLFLEVCRAHGAATVYHHQRLVMPFLVQPAKAAPPQTLDHLTASGPPLEIVIGMLERLRDLRVAKDRPGLRTAQEALARLRVLIE